MADMSEEDYRAVAHTMREMYTAFLLEGFNEAQALHLTGKAIEGVMQR